MNKLIVVLLLGILFCGIKAAAQTAVKYGNIQDLNKSDTCYLLLLAGQSNMVGSGKLADIKGNYEFNNIFYYNFGMNTNLKISNENFGPEFGISKELNNHFPDKKFILIKYAIGGSSLLDWSPVYNKTVAEITGHPEFGNIYDSLMKKSALLTSGLTVKNAALVWMQGERDARIPEAGMNYYLNFKAFIESVREDLNSPYLPVIFGRINPPKNMYPAVDKVVHAQEKISEEIPNTYLISTENLEKWTDNVHYSSVGQIELGRRFGKKLTELLRNNEKGD